MRDTVESMYVRIGSERRATVERFLFTEEIDLMFTRRSRLMSGPSENETLLGVNLSAS